VRATLGVPAAPNLRAAAKQRAALGLRTSLKGCVVLGFTGVRGLGGGGEAGVGDAGIVGGAAGGGAAEFVEDLGRVGGEVVAEAAGQRGDHVQVGADAGRGFDGLAPEQDAASQIPQGA